MGKKRQFDENEVLFTITEHFRKHGYSATKVDQIATITGLTKTSLYHAFGNKESLFLRVLDFYLQNSLHATLKGMDLNLPLSENLNTMLQDAFLPSDRNQVANGCLLTNSIVELSCNEPKLYEAVTEKYKSVHQAMQVFFSTYIENGKLSDNLNAEELTNLYMTFHQGLQVQSCNQDNKAIMKKSIQAFIRLIQLSEKQSG